MRISEEKGTRRDHINLTKVNNPTKFVIWVLLCIVSFMVGGLLYENGIHTSLKYIAQGRYDELQNGVVRDTLEELGGLIKSETTAYSGNNLSTLYLDIPFENLQVIQLKRDDALKNGILLSSDEDYVSASIRYNDSAPIDIKIRLKGDWTDHLEGDKWSYRIHIEDDAAIEGMTRFSIQAPETRDFVYEWVYHETLKQEGVLAPRYTFVNVVENGVNKGVYALEESFYTELMESQERRSGVIVRFDEDDMWQNWSTFFSNGMEDMRTAADASGYFMQADLESATISSFGQGKILTNPVLLAEYRTAQEMLRNYQTGKSKASEVFDMEKMGKFLAVTEFWGAGHALAWHNLRFYYNPVTNLLEPIGFDGIPMVEPYNNSDIDFIVNETKIFQDIENRKAFYQESRTILAREYVDQQISNYSDQMEIFDSALSKEYEDYIPINWERIYQRNESLMYQLHQIEVSGIFYLPSDTENLLVVELSNSYFLPLVIDQISIGDTIINLSEIEYENVIVPESLLSLNGQYQQALKLPDTISVSGNSEVNVKLIVQNDDSNFIWISIPYRNGN